MGDGGSNPTSPLDFRISRIANVTAKGFVETWHYSHRIPTGKNICFGLFVAGNLYAVIVYGIGVNPYQAQFLGVKETVEIKRMCRSEPRREYPLSRFIALTIKMLKREMSFDCIVAFADPEYGHEGRVYAASGFRKEGMTNAEWHLVDNAGNTRHRRFAFRYARRHRISIAEARNALAVRRIRTAPKHRWVRRLNGIARTALDGQEKDNG